MQVKPSQAKSTKVEDWAIMEQENKAAGKVIVIVYVR